MKIALIGFGIENKAAFAYLNTGSNSIAIHDYNPNIDIPDDATSVLGPEYLDDLNQYDLIIRTSGMHPSVILDKNPEVKDKLTTAINIFFENCKTPIIGVTGTKGKGTTSTLIHQILEADGKRAIIAGNIGIPALSMLDEANRSDFVVLELSSFQLYDLKHSPKIGVCLMVVPEHLNWHSDLDDYLQAKANLFAYQTSYDTVVFNADNENSMKVTNASKANNRLGYSTKNQQAVVHIENNKICFGPEMACKISDIKLLGRHNLENVSAAIAATWQITNKNTNAIQSTVSTFGGLPYRLEYIRQINGVKYYNDSFSTTPETAIAAIESFTQPKIVILGGSDKGVPFDELADKVICSNVKHVIAIGQTGQIIATLLQNLGYSNITTSNLSSMDKIIATASSLADPGDIVLMSTGSASFDMFKDYKDRGNQFNQAVQALS